MDIFKKLIQKLKKKDVFVYDEGVRNVDVIESEDYYIIMGERE